MKRNQQSSIRMTSLCASRRSSVAQNANSYCVSSSLIWQLSSTVRVINANRCHGHKIADHIAVKQVDHTAAPVIPATSLTNSYMTLALPTDYKVQPSSAKFQGRCTRKPLLSHQVLAA